MCGFPKDNFFYYKAWWRKEPVLHLFPHWNWEGREGEEIPVWVHSNLDEVELFLNGKSQGRQKVPRLGHVEWKVRYEPGAIEAQGWKDGKLVLTREARDDRTGCVAAADGRSHGRSTPTAKMWPSSRSTRSTAHGRAVPTASDLINFKVTGEGALIGVGNGDPNCQESDKEPRRSLFNGLAQVIVQSTKTPGTIEVEASVMGRVTPAKLSITTRQVQLRPADLSALPLIESRGSRSDYQLLQAASSMAVGFEQGSRRG